MAKDGESSSQTLKGSPLRNRGVWQTGVQYFDGTTQSDGGLFYQDFVSYTHSVVTDGTSKNVTDFYVCKRQCASIVPTNTDYWDKLSDMGPIYTDVLVAMKAYIKELTAEEVIITDNENIVAGMTSGNSDKVSSQGDVRIWAGTNDKNASNIAEAPFTVTDKGVLTCRGNDGNITLKDGTIYFIVGGIEYKLGVTNGKPDWINSAGADSTEIWYQKRESDTNVSFNQVGTFAIKGNQYYTDATMHTTVNGIYYKKIHAGALLYNVGSYTYLTYGSIFGVELYNKASFTNGSKTSLGSVAITGAVSVHTIPSENGGTLNVNTANKTWAKISRVDKPTGTFTYYIADRSNSSQDSVPYKNVESDNIIFNYNTNDGIYVISASDKENPNLPSTLSSWIQNLGTGSSSNVYEIRNLDLNGNFIP